MPSRPCPWDSRRGSYGELPRPEHGHGSPPEAASKLIEYRRESDWPVLSSRDKLLTRSVHLSSPEALQLKATMVVSHWNKVPWAKQQYASLSIAGSVLPKGYDFRFFRHQDDQRSRLSGLFSLLTFNQGLLEQVFNGDLTGSHCPTRLWYGLVDMKPLRF